MTWVVIVLVGGFVLLNMLAARHARAMLSYEPGGAERTARPESLGLGARLAVLFRGVRIPRPEPCEPIAALSGAAQAVRIALPAGGPGLAGWLHDAGAGTPVVVCFHGYSADKTRLLGEARAFLAMGASVLLVDFRGSGESPGCDTTIGVREAEDVAAVFAFTRTRWPDRRVVLYGQSMGAAAILRAIAAHGVAPDGIIIEEVFDTLLQTVRNRFRAMRAPTWPGAELLVFWGGVRFGFNGFAVRPVDDARSVRCQTLFIHGVDDPRARLADGRRVFANVRGPAEFLEVAGAGHESCLARAPEEWTGRVRAFLAKVRTGEGA